MQWLAHWQQQELHLSTTTWQQRVRALLVWVAPCLRRTRWPKQQLPRPSGMDLFSNASGAGPCVLLNKQLLQAPSRRPLLTFPGAKAHRGQYVGIKLGHCLVGQPAGPSSSSAATAAAASAPAKVAVVVQWHQLVALADHGFPASAQRRHALHLPQDCHLQHGLCGCSSHVGWGSAQENIQHKLLTTAARQERFTKVPLHQVVHHLQRMAPAAQQAACSSKARASALVDEVAAQLRHLSLQAKPLAAPPPPPLPKTSPVLTRRRRKEQAAAAAGELELQLQQLQQLPKLPARSSLPSKLKQAQLAAERRREAYVALHGEAAWDAKECARAARATAVEERRKLRLQRWEKEWGGGSSSNSSGQQAPA
jgi:hypothetical protein